MILSQEREKSIIDSLLEIATYSPTKHNFKKLNIQIKKADKFHFKNSFEFRHILCDKYKIGVVLYECQKFDSSLIYFEFVHNSNIKGLKDDNINYADLYSKMFNIYILKNISQSSMYLSLSHKNGNDDLEDLTTYYRHNDNLTHDSIFKMLHFSNINFLNNNTKFVNGDVDLIFRYITISDQLYRIDCYNRNVIKYNVVTSNDSVLQSIFSTIILNIDGLSVLKNPTYQKTFYLLLLHSVSAPNNCYFFEKHFKLFSEAFFNNYIEFSSIKGLIDNYLKFKYNKQFFDTDWGMGRRLDDSWGLLDKVSETELLQVFKKLDISNPKYK